MFRFTIRDVLWLTALAALAVSWWVDSKRIEKAVSRVEEDRQKMMTELEDKRAELEDKITILDQAQRKLRDERWGRVVKRPALSGEK